MKKTVRIAALAAAIAVLFSIAACGNNSGEPVVAIAPVENQTPADAAPLAATIDLRYYPDPPVSLKDTQFTISVRDDDSVAIEGASVMLDLSMPGMYHGENRPALTETRPGVYEGTGVLTMGGGWLAKVEVSSDGATAVREFTFDAVEK